MLVSYWLFRAYSLKTDAIDGTVICMWIFKLASSMNYNFSILHQRAWNNFHIFEMSKYKHGKKKLTKITVQTYAPVARGIPMAVAPSGRERSWFTLIPISKRASASHYNKIKDTQDLSNINMKTRQLWKEGYTQTSTIILSDIENRSYTNNQ